MTTQIHKFHTRDTEEQLYDVPLHDVELNDVANVRHKSASSCVPSWLQNCHTHEQLNTSLHDIVSSLS